MLTEDEPILENAFLPATGPEEAMVEPPPAQGGRRRSIVFLAGALAGGNVLSMLLRMVGGYFQARLVVPAMLGLFNGIGLVMNYIPFLQLGILHGLNRELPYYVGRGEYDRVKQLAAAAQAWAC